MKKIERKFTTDRYEVIVVRFEAEEEDFRKAQDKGPSTPYPMPVAIEIPESYVMIGPVGGPFARFDRTDINVLNVLTDSMPRVIRPGACPIHG